VPKKIKKSLNADIIDHWPEILEDVDLSAVPIFYLHSVVITFNDGNHWDVILKKEDKTMGGEHFSRTLHELFENYQDNIKHVDFRLDIEQVKKDVTKHTKKFFMRKK
jgi:hypothetical protein